MAAAAGPWDQYAAPAGAAPPTPPPSAPPLASAAPAGPWTQYAPQSADTSASRQASSQPPGGFDLTGLGLRPAPAPAATPSTAAASASPDTSDASLGHRFGLGVRNVLEGTIGLPYDLTAAGLRTIGLPVNSLDTNLTALGLPDATTPRQQIVGAGVQGGAAAVTPATLVGGLARVAMMAPSTAARVTSALGDLSLSNAALGASAGVTGDLAAQAVPDQYEPLASVLGSLAGVGLPLAGVAGIRGGASALGDLVGQAGFGPRTVLRDNSGQALTGANGKPVAYTPAQARAAGTQIAAAASNPPAVASTLADLGPQLVAGSAPTTFQVTADPGLGQLERAAAIRLPEAFLARSADQNAARVGAVQDLAPSGSSADALPAAMQSRAALLDQANQAEVAGAQARSQATLNAIGGDQGPGAENQLGAAIRAPADQANQAARTQEQALWNAIDPDGTLAVSMVPVRERAAAIVNGMSPNAAPPVGNEAGILQTAQGLPDVQSFQDLAALRSRLTDAIRAERGPQGDPQAVRRMSMLLDGVHDAMAGAVNDTAAGDSASAGSATPPSSAASENTSASAPSSPLPTAALPTAPTAGSAVFTPSGQRVDVQYGLREAGDLIPSQLDDGRVNPAYPQELQPRDRTRNASVQQINSMANRLEPERLGASASTAEGAPIVGPDGIVESGNGRTLAIRQAYAQNPERAAAYKDWLTSQGYDHGGMTEPVLVRERTTPMSPAERVRFADAAGASPVLGMSAAERAAADVKRLPDDVLSLYRGGDVTDARNAPLVRAFAEHAVPPGEMAGFATADGKLSEEGAARLRNALTQRAYGSNSLVSALAEHADDNVRTFGNALVDAAPAMAKLRGAIASGMVSKETDLSPALVEAAGLVQQARRRGISLADAVAQKDAFSQRGEMVEAVLKAAYGDDLAGRMSRGKLADLLTHYADEVQVQSGLFGENRTPAQMLAEATQKYGYGTRGSARSGSTAAVNHGPSIGADGDQARGPVDGASRQADAAAASRPGAAAASIIPAAPTLVPNFDQAAAARYQAARQATAERAATFKSPPGVGQVLQGGQRAGEFRLPDSGVPAAIFTPGKGGADRVQAYLTAGGSKAALADYAAWSLRRSATKDGVLDPAAYGRWARGHESALSAMPDVEARLLNAATAQEAVGQAVAQRAAQARAFEKSVAGQFLGDADPAARVGKILRSDTARADMAKLARLTQNDPVARAGLQRAVVDHILDTMKGNAAAGSTGTTQLKGDALQTFFRRAEPALAEVFPKRQVEVMRDIAADLQRSNLSVSGSKLPGGSNTPQDVAGSERFGGFAGTLLGRFQAHGAELAGAMIGAALHGSLGAGLGTITARVANSMREAGIATVDDLKAHAMLDPVLAHTLMARVTADNREQLLRTLATRLARVSLVGTATGETRRP